MPVIPQPPPTAPYDVSDTILNFARVIANDCALSLAGNLLADTQPYTFTMLSLSWRKLQDRLGNNAIESFPQEITITVPAMPNASTTDPETRSSVGFANYFDGTNNNAAPLLPQDLEIPLKLWERQSGINALFVEMYPAHNGLPDRPKTSLLREWEWRDDAIFLEGALQTNDVRIRYKKFMADLAAAGTTPIPLLRCAVALAYLVCECFAEGRGGAVSEKFSIQKEDAIKQLINNTTRKKQYTNFRRQPYSRRGNRLNW